jgi:hypothetical protein
VPRSREYLTRIYDSIEAHPIEMAVQTPAEIAAAQANINQKLAANDLAASRLGINAADGSGAGGHSQSKSVSNEMRIAGEKAFAKDVCRGIRDSEGAPLLLCCDILPTTTSSSSSQICCGPSLASRIASNSRAWTPRCLPPSLTHSLTHSR